MAVKKEKSNTSAVSGFTASVNKYVGRECPEAFICCTQYRVQSAKLPSNLLPAAMAGWQQGLQKRRLPGSMLAMAACPAANPLLNNTVCGMPVSWLSAASVCSKICNGVLEMRALG